jgi:hypothetical protein
MNEEMQKEIIDLYQAGHGSIQDLARIYRVSVQEVLNLTGNGALGQVSTGGDLISESDAGPNVQMNYGKSFQVPFTVD